jgi:uncharacterized heparinase superfamily protein
LARAGHLSLRLWTFAGQELARRARLRLRSSRLQGWRYVGRTPERVLIAPPDLRLADPQIAEEIYHGRFPFAGHLVETGGASPFQIEVNHRPWLDALHGFRWLRHLRAAGTELASANARALVSEWIAGPGRRLRGPAWEPATTARRIMAWLQHSTVVLKGADYPFYRAFLRSLAFQIRYLRAAVALMPDGEERLRARIALTLSVLSLPASPAGLRSATRHLAFELERQILPDGGHVSRNPMAILELLADLLPLRQTYANQAETPPDALMNAIDRMLPALRFFRHQDGTLARFNGMGATLPDRVAAILRHDDTGGQALLHAPHSGYDRMTLGTTTVIADTGPPPPIALSGEAHAGCLSFEMSSGRSHLIVNSGVDVYGPDDFRPLARATAAHSTATLNDSSSCRFDLPPKLAQIVGTPIVSGPRKVPCRRIDDRDAQGFVASHDGYVGRFGIVHERALRLGEEGAVLEGRDRFLSTRGRSARSEDEVALRFHLHPDSTLLSDGQSRLVIASRHGEQWLFSVDDGAHASVEETIFFAGLAGPRRSRQIVFSFRLRERTELGWRISRLPSG